MARWFPAGSNCWFFSLNSYVQTSTVPLSKSSSHTRSKRRSLLEDAILDDREGTVEDAASHVVDQLVVALPTLDPVAAADMRHTSDAVSDLPPGGPLT